MKELKEAVVGEIAFEVGLQASFIEKDARVAELLSALSNIEMPDGMSLVFAGGTCLARAYCLTARMSEDVDIKLTLDASLGNAAKRRRLSDFKQLVRDAIAELGFEIQDEWARNNNQNVNYKLTYASLFDSAGTVMREHIQLETTQSNPRLPTQQMPVSSFVSGADGSGPDVISIACVNLNEMAAEKFVALTRRVAGELEGTKAEVWDPALVRHIYDLKFLQPHVDMTVVAPLVREVMRQDAKQFASWFPAYAADPEGQTKLALSALESQQRFRDDYERFHDEMVYSEPVGYVVGLKAVREMATSILAPDR